MFSINIKRFIIKIISFFQYLFFIFILISIIFLVTLVFVPEIGYKFLDKIDRFFISINKDEVIAKISYNEIIDDSNTTENFNLNNNTDKIYILVAPKQQINKQNLKLYPNFQFQKIGGILEIPAIGVKGKIISGKNQNIMLQGFWHVNINGAWLEAGNIVIFGHRFYHVPPAKDTFFNLDKVKIGDSIIIKTDIGTWFYQVYGVSVISKYNTSIFQNSKVPELTLVTCHPLWSSQKRLVVRARLQTAINFD